MVGHILGFVLLSQRWWLSTSSECAANLQDTNFNGADLRHAAASSYEECCEMCGAAQGCRFWVFDTNQKRCRMKATSGQPLVGQFGYKAGEVSKDHKNSVNIVDVDSWGVQFIFGFATLVILYLGLGALYSCKFRRARGVEMIPNRLFWIGLPALVNDGVVFFHCKMTGKDPPKRKSPDYAPVEATAMMADENSWDEEAGKRARKEKRKKDKKEEKKARRKSTPVQRTKQLEDSEATENAFDGPAPRSTKKTRRKSTPATPVAPKETEKQEPDTDNSGGSNVQQRHTSYSDMYSAAPRRII